MMRVFKILAQILVEPIKRSGPREFRSLFVVTWRGVVVEAVLFAVIHV